MSPYQFGTRSPETERLQRVLTDHTPSFDTKGTDGIYGRDTRDAVQAAQEYYAISPADGVVRADLLLELAITAPAPPRSNPFEDMALRLGLKLLLNKLFPGKDINVDNVLVAVKSMWASKINWASILLLLWNVLSLFGWNVPDDIKHQAVVLVDAIGAIYIFIARTWGTSTILTPAAKKLP